MVEFESFDTDPSSEPASSPPPAAETSATVNALAGIAMVLVVTLVGFMLISAPPRAPRPEETAEVDAAGSESDTAATPTPNEGGEEGGEEGGDADDESVPDITSIELPELPAPVASLHARAPFIELAFAVSENELAVVGFQPGSVPRLAAEIVTATRGMPDPSDELLRTSNHQTFALAFGALGTTATVTAGDIVQVDSESLALVYNPVYAGLAISQPIRIVDHSVASFASADSHDIDRPAGASDLIVDGVGALVISPNGATSIATADGLQPFSDHRMLAASGRGSRFELRCLDPTACTPVFVDPNATERPILADFASLDDSYLISPDDSMILRMTPSGSAEVYFVTTGARAWVIGTGLTEAVFAPDSSYIAWIDTTEADHPLLKFMFPETRDWLAFDPVVLGAGTPADDRLIVLG